MTSDHDMFGMLRGARKRLRKNSFFKQGKRVSNQEWVETQKRLWKEWEAILAGAHKEGVVSDIGLQHLRNRENVLKQNWGCKP